jgi:hypothetical protein
MAVYKCCYVVKGITISASVYLFVLLRWKARFDEAWPVPVPTTAGHPCPLARMLLVWDDDLEPGHGVAAGCHGDTSQTYL